LPFALRFAILYPSFKQHNIPQGSGESYWNLWPFSLI